MWVKVLEMKQDSTQFDILYGNPQIDIHMRQQSSTKQIYLGFFNHNILVSNGVSHLNYINFLEILNL